MRAFALWLLLAAATSAQGVIGGQVSGLPQAPPRDPGVAPLTGTGSIRGRITAADTGAPLRRALVNLGGPQKMRGTYTDHEGRYEFNDLPPGTYNLFVNPGSHRAGYQSTPYGASPSSFGFNMRPKPIELADGQRIANLDVALLRTGVITGRVTDADGQPAARVQVGAWLIRPGSDPAQTSSAQTDDLGQFRLFNLMPGDYFIMANPPMGGGGPADIEGEPTGFAPTYAPGTPVRSEATRLRVARGAEVSADIQLFETRVHSISGTVVTSKGDAVGNVSVMLMRSETATGPRAGASVTPAGTFTIRNVPPGEYDLVARYMPPREPGTMIQGPNPDQEYGFVRVDVRMSDLTGVVLATQPGATVAGEIVLEGETAEGRRASLHAQTTERRAFMGPPLLEVKESTFSMRNAFGPVVLRGSVGGAPGWGLKAVLLRGKDITDVPTTFTASDSGHLQVVFTDKAPSVEGVVVDESGKPAAEAAIILFGRDPSTWQPRSSYYRTGRIVKDGRYAINGLREGQYYAVAVPLDVPLNLGQPSAELLESLSKVATAVTLNAGEKRPVDLTLVRLQQQ
jgi:hypothetical protein